MLTITPRIQQAQLLASRIGVAFALAILGVLVLRATASGSSIKVDKILATPSKLEPGPVEQWTFTGLDISGAAPNTDVGVNVGQGGATTDTESGGRTDASGGFSTTLGGPENVGDSMVLSINAETYSIVPGTSGLRVESNEQAAEHQGSSLNQFDLLPYSPIASFFYVGDQLFSQILLNSSSSTPYLTVFDLYTDLDLSFYDPLHFASPAALVSGVFRYTTSTTFTNNPYGLALPFGAVDPSTYVLLTGTSRAVLGPGQFGPEIGFSTAATVVPEPATIQLCAIAIGATLIHRTLRRRRRALSLAV